MSEEGVPLLATFYRLFEPVTLLKGLEDGRVHKLQVKLIPAARSIIGFEAEQLTELRASLGAGVDILSDSAEPFAVGHVVRHAVRGRGTVTEHMPGDLFEPDGRVRVLFDSGEEHRYNQKSLRKLKDESLSESKLHQLMKLHTGRKAWFARLLEP